MGMNYYWYPENKCEECGREGKPIHIGKSSYGWPFGLHVYPDGVEDDKDLVIANLTHWEECFNNSDSYIKDEDGRIISIEEMLDTIKNREDLNAERDIDDRHCISHGESTYDLCVGYEDFW